MSIDKTAWIHPNPVNSGFVILPDGFEMRRREAEAKGFTVEPWPETERVAAPHPHEKDFVVLSRGQVVSVDTARSAGFVITESAHNARTNPIRSWRSSIMRLPEAQNRTSAAAEILTSQSPETLTVDAARAFLRGLPTELTEEQPTMTTNNPDPRAARKAEITNSMAAFNRNNGYAAKAAAGAAPSEAAIDPTKLKRKAEIRLNALESGHASDNAGEGKKLRYALQVHSQTGMPLATVLTQFGVDTSKLIRA
jgi:hypothetical protein